MTNEELLHILIGEWAGTGQGEFPTIEPFEYRETLVFASDQRPFLHYETKSRRRRAGQEDFVPSHWESGFLRLLPNGEVEMVNTQSSGRLERLVGSIQLAETGLVLHLKSTSFLNDPRMVETERTIVVEDNIMTYTQTMYTNAVAGPAQHVSAQLKRK
jgi:hypothetical protein